MNDNQNGGEIITPELMEALHNFAQALHDLSRACAAAIIDAFEKIADYIAPLHDLGRLAEEAETAVKITQPAARPPAMTALLRGYLYGRRWKIRKKCAVRILRRERPRNNPKELRAGLYGKRWRLRRQTMIRIVN